MVASCFVLREVVTRARVQTFHPWMAMWLAAAIFSVVLAFILFGDGLRGARGTAVSGFRRCAVRRRLPAYQMALARIALHNGVLSRQSS